MLRFSEANAKTHSLCNNEELSQYLTNNRKVYSFDLLSGWSCPFANECLSKAVVTETSRKIKDGPNTKFRCFSASQEVQYPSLYNLRKNNFDVMRSLERDIDMCNMLNEHVPNDAGIVRIHVGGDFFSKNYMFAWMLLASRHTDRLFYAYTKSLRYWIDIINAYEIPDNFVLTASYGGRDDHLISEYNLRYSQVVFSEKEAEDLGLEIDHDDSHAARPSLKNQSFALLIHGTQPKESEAANALKQLKRNKIKHSYSRK